jgi:gliding motility associated protien GldN
MTIFKFKLSFDEIEEKLVAIDTLDAGRDQLNAGEKIDPQYINKRTITSREIRQYWVKGIWYFDRRLGELKYRMLGIAPVAPDVNFLNQAEEEQDLIPLFWIWYPDARVTLHNTKVFNKENTSRPISFDNLLNSRRFSSIIYKEDNVYEDRKIGDYIFEDAMLRLMESDRIKAKILNFEQDMWNN